MTNFEARKTMWAMLGRLFADSDAGSFVWIFSPDDMEEANRMPDGIGNYGYIGVARGCTP